MPVGLPHATTLDVAGSGDIHAHWRALRDAGDIQFAPLPPAVPEPPSPWGQWLARAFELLGKLLRPLFEPLGKALGVGWPVMKIALVVAAVALLLALAWRVLPSLAKWRRRRPEARGEAGGWLPEAGETRALLADADALAEAGRFDEAVHVLLTRSIDQIAAARPEWIGPARTAREIAGARSLPGDARRAFGAMAERVERSRFALRALDAADWAAARAAYAEFALQRIRSAA